LRYKYVLRMLWGYESFEVEGKDLDEALRRLAEELDTTPATVLSVTEKIYEMRDGEWVLIWEEEEW